MKKMTMFVPIVAVLVILAVAPMVASAKACCLVPASATSIPIAYPGSPYPAPTVPTISTPNPNIIIIKDMPAYYSHALAINGKTYTGISCDAYNAVGNFKTEVFTIYSKETWYFGAFGNLANGFKGNTELTLFGWTGDDTFTSVEVHAVLQGFGSFSGQTLMLSYEGPSLAAPWTGYDLMT